MHLVKNLFFYIGLFLFLFGIGNYFFNFIPDYSLQVTYVSYFGLFLITCGTPYPKSNNSFFTSLPMPPPISHKEELLDEKSKKDKEIVENKTDKTDK